MHFSMSGENTANLNDTLATFFVGGATLVDSRERFRVGRDLLEQWRDEALLKSDGVRETGKWAESLEQLVNCELNEWSSAASNPIRTSCIDDESISGSLAARALWTTLYSFIPKANFSG